MRRSISALIKFVAITIMTTVPAFAQTRPATSVEPVLWSSMQEDYLDEDGNLMASYQYRLAPLKFMLGAVISDSWALEGMFSYSRLFSPDNPPRWAFSPNHIGTAVEAEGLAKWMFLSTANFRLGYTYTTLDRDLSIYSRGRYNAVNIETTYSGPVLGIGLDVDDGRFIFKAHFDTFPYLRQTDSYNPAANSTSGIGDFNWRLGATLGYYLTENLALIGTGGAKRFDMPENADGADGRRRTTWKSLGVGVQMSF
jgi:hypothetical protein